MMKRDKLIITDKKYKGEKTVVSARLPIELVNTIDEIASSTGRTRNDIMQKCLEFAVENIVYEDKAD